MAKEEGVKTVVVGGKKDVQQQFCGTVGGQSTDFSTMDTEVKVSTSRCLPLPVRIWSSCCFIIDRPLISKTALLHHLTCKSRLPSFIPSAHPYICIV